MQGPLYVAAGPTDTQAVASSVSAVTAFGWSDQTPGQGQQLVVRRESRLSPSTYWYILSRYSVAGYRTEPAGDSPAGHG